MTLSAKDDLRRTLRALRRALPPTVRAGKSHEILERLRTHPAYRSSRNPALTHPVGSEVDLLPLIQERLSSGLGAILPVVIAEGRMVFHRLAGSIESLRPTTLGIPEPVPDASTLVPPSEIDLMILPGIGFDPAGGRLGQGGGYFDRFLGSLPERVPSLGLAFECQMVEEIPTEDGDRRVDEVLTERTVYRAGRAEVRSGSIEETHRMAAEIAQVLEPPVTVRLHGELGAGKTEWVRGFARARGWEGRVRSPTFSLENVYELPEASLYHLDGYRLTDPSGLDRDWFEEILEDPRGIVLLEWPDRFGESVPRFSPLLEVHRTEGESRTLVWKSFEKRHALPIPEV